MGPKIVSNRSSMKCIQIRLQIEFGAIILVVTYNAENKEDREARGMVGR
jgi:hypothetical protein